MLDFDGGGSLETDEFCQGRTSVPVPELSRDYPNTNIHTNIILYYNILYYTKLYFFFYYTTMYQTWFRSTQRRKSSPWCAPVLRSSEAHVWLHEVGLIFETSGGCIEAPFQKLVKQRELCHHSYPYHRSPWALNSAMRPEPRLKTFVDSAWDLSKILVNLQKT